MAAVELYKFPPRPWLPGGALPRVARVQVPGGPRAEPRALAYLGRRQEVGPEAGSGRLEGEHGAAACAPRPCGRSDASGTNVPGANAQAGSAARPAGPTDGPGPTRPRARPRWAGPGGATPIPGSGARSPARSSLAAPWRSATVVLGAAGPREAILRARSYGGSQGSRRPPAAYCDLHASGGHAKPLWSVVGSVQCSCCPRPQFSGVSHLR